MKFIFATTQPNKVLPTILSRCQRLDFRRIPSMEMVEQLEKICKKEDVKLGKEVLFAIAKSSDGSLRDAESVLDQLLAFSRQDLSLKEVVSLLGLVEQEALFEITDCLISKDPLGALRLLNNVIDSGKDTGLFLNNLIEHFRNLMVAKITNADAKLIDMPPEICERLLKQAGAFKLEEIFSAFNTLVSSQEMSKRMDSFRIPLEISLVKLAHDGKGSFPQHAHAAHPAEEKPAAVKEHKKEDAADPEVEVVGSGGSITMEEIENSWDNVIVNLGKIKMAVATYMNEARPLKIVNNVLTVSLPKNCSFHKNSLERKENKEIIEKALSELLHNKLRVIFLLSQEEAAKEDAETTPFLKSALEAFKGRIIRQE